MKRLHYGKIAYHYCLRFCSIGNTLRGRFLYKMCKKAKFSDLQGFTPQLGTELKIHKKNPCRMILNTTFLKKLVFYPEKLSH